MGTGKGREEGGMGRGGIGKDEGLKKGGH